MPAFRLAVEQGADAIELDVRLTADRVPVVLHDARLDRTTGRRALVRELGLTALSEFDAGAMFTSDRGRTHPFRGAGIRIPTLQEVIRAFPELCFLVELKEVDAQGPVRQVLLEEQATDRCVLASEHHAALEVFRHPPFAVAASGREIGLLYRATLLRRVPDSVSYQTLSVPERHRGLRIPTRRFVAAARRLGCPVHVWTINDPGSARRLWQDGATGIVTNHPDRMRA
ncbi:MAG TPA: glycerophosphodiester phosphodiesterase family protein, partial [Gemmatimonadales bacterium]|nr:glycerophosphodiester phosphodiesterase family protein [Gemmatimonadales bacterium]